MRRGRRRRLRAEPPRSGVRLSGLNPDQALEAIIPTLHDLMVSITRDAPALNAAFEIQLVDWFP